MRGARTETITSVTKQTTRGKQRNGRARQRAAKRARNDEAEEQEGEAGGGREERRQRRSDVEQLRPQGSS